MSTLIGRPCRPDSLLTEQDRALRVELDRERQEGHQGRQNDHQDGGADDVDQSLDGQAHGAIRAIRQRVHAHAVDALELAHREYALHRGDGDPHDLAFLLADVDRLLDQLLHREGQAYRHLVHDLAVQDRLEVVDHAQQGPVENDVVLRRIGSEVADHDQTQVGMALHQIGEGHRAGAGAQHQHVPDVAPVVARKDQDLPHDDPDADGGGGQGREDHDQQQPAYVRQLEEVQHAQGEGQLDESCPEDYRYVSTPGPSSPTSIQAVDPQHGDPHADEDGRGKAGVRQGGIDVGRPSGHTSESEIRRADQDGQRKHDVGGRESQAKCRAIAADHVPSPSSMGTRVHSGPEGEYPSHPAESQPPGPRVVDAAASTWTRMRPPRESPVRLSLVAPLSFL